MSRRSTQPSRGFSWLNITTITIITTIIIATGAAGPSWWCRHVGTVTTIITTTITTAITDIETGHAHKLGPGCDESGPGSSFYFDAFS